LIPSRFQPTIILNLAAGSTAELHLVALDLVVAR